MLAQLAAVHRVLYYSHCSGRDEELDLYAVVRWLVEAGCDVNVPVERGRTALDWARRFPQSDRNRAIAQILVGAGAVSRLGRDERW